MKFLLIRDLVSTKELSREERAAVRGGVMPGGCLNPPVPAIPAVPFNPDPRVMIEAIYARIPGYPPMNPMPMPGPIMVAQ
ncbi:MAG: hypothetical protein ACKVQT_11130 [Burkholderiales bacterium]